MTPTKKQTKMASILILVSVLFSITLTYATGEGDYKNDTNVVTNVFEGSFTENGYKANIIINPTITGAYNNENNYKLDLTINPNGTGDARDENGYRLDLTPQRGFPEEHDLRVTNIKTSRSRVGKGYNVIMDVTVSNLQLNFEKFFLTINASNTIINTQQKTLTSRESATISFTWNTADVNYGYYTISARAIPVPGEAFTWDNTLIGGVVMVTIPGDVNGDKTVDVLDLFDLSKAYSSTGGPPPSSNWDILCDINSDNYVDNLDLYLLSINYLKSWA